MVRLIAGDGQQVGIVSVAEALERAASEGLDLVEVAPDAKPPVCRVMDYGKFKYQQQKKQQDSKKGASRTQVKEIKMRPKIADHDYGFKMKKVLQFLEGGNRVKVTVQFRGREIAYVDSGRELLQRVVVDVGELGQVDGTPKMAGRFLSMIVAPK